MNIVDKILDLKIIPVVRNVKKRNIQKYLEILMRYEINLVEVTCMDDESFKLIEYVRNTYPQVTVGAGTILNPAQVTMAVDAGAEFLVSPGFLESVVKLAQAKGVIMIPGVATASEIMKAISENLLLVKVFPAIQLTPYFFREIKGPFPKIKLIAVGGITCENIENFLKAGADCVGIGSGLFKDNSGKDIYENGFEVRLKKFKEIIEKYKFSPNFR
ncbi:MAG: bifunctional 4-hydroxy-2-oxoglutarate aldolase/2-dehydro-3-deoxy-phosphogluconate aldolase [Nitrososphaeria archaeon]|jgi:2-dehydro-3-deoxyphosphogluconate aldolase/(4S)-4-hydroxy-2-oxoglutarate aldolase